MYEELIKALRICGSGLYSNPCPFSINERCTFGCWMDTGRKAASALESLTAQLAALQSENAELRKQRPVQVDGDVMALTLELAETKAALSRVEAERDVFKRALHLSIETHSVDPRQIERLERHYLEQASGPQREEGQDG